jgi:capsid portal protein
MPTVREFRTADGGAVSARVITLSRDTPNSQVALLARAALAPILQGASDQLQIRNTTARFGAYDIEHPPLNLDRLVALSRSEPMHRACLEAKAHAVAGQGYRIRPASELVMSDQSVVSYTPDPEKHLDDSQKARIVAFLESALPDYSFSETLVATERDLEALGQGFIEIARRGDAQPDAMYPCKSISIRLLADGRGYVQRRGYQTRIFAKYTPGGAKTAQVGLVRGDQGGLMVEVRAWGSPDHLLRTNEVQPSMGLDQFLVDASSDSAQVFSVNELLMFRKGTTLDTNYGEPDIISAMYDAVGGQLAAIYNMDYFENNTIPRMAIVARGGTLSEAVIQQVEDWINGRNLASVANQVLLIDVPDPNTQLDFEKFGATQLSDASFDGYRGMVDEHIRVAHRTPAGMVSLAGDEVADFRFISQVVRPRQRDIESRFNYIFREEFGITDWVLDLNVPDIVGEARRAEIFDILLRRGVITINEVRYYFGLPPVDGGDKPFVLVPGAGVVPIETVNEVVDAIRKGDYKPGAMTATTGQKTPPTGAPVFGDTVQRALTMKVGDLADFSPSVQQEMAAILESLWNADPELVRQLLPAGFH